MLTILLILLLLFLVLLLVSPLVVGVVILAKKQVATGTIILTVYASIFGAFLIYAQLEKRSTAGHILRWFKGEYGMKQRANDFAEDLEKILDPVELQQWAITVLQSTQQETNSDSELPRDKVLKSIRDLKSDGLEFEFVTYDHFKTNSPQIRTVWIIWGGGFGHWGIRVGPPTFKVNSTKDDNYYVEWKPGIYFWGETH